jgi:hypothetical protein
MSVFAANKKWLSVAQTAMSNAETVATQQRDINVGRELLTNIRQYRIQHSMLEQAEATLDGTSIGGMQTAKQFLQQQVEQPYQRAVDDAERKEKIEGYQRQADAAISRFKKQAKTARTTGYITSAVLAVAGGALFAAAAAGGAFGAAVAGSSTAIGAVGAVGGAAVGSLGGTAVGEIAGADSNYYGGVVKGTITGASIAGTAGSAGWFGAPAAEAGGGMAVTKLGTETISQSTWTSTNAISFSDKLLAAGTIMNTIGGAVKDINGYQVKVPITQGYGGQNYSQYVQSFRGFA